MNIDLDLEDIIGPEVEAPKLEVVQERVEPVNLPIHREWARFKDRFATAMEDGLYTIEALEKKIGQGKAIFLPGRDAAIVAEKVTYDGGRSVLQTLWAVGDLQEVIALSPGLEAMGRIMGCSQMLVEGRKGWEKVLAPHGYKPWSVTLTKDLT